MHDAVTAHVCLVGTFRSEIKKYCSCICRARKLPQRNCTASKDAELVEGASASRTPDSAPPPERWNWLDSADAQRSHAILVAVLAAGTLPWAQEQSNAPLVYFVALAVTTIYIGSHKALTTDLRQQISIKEVSVLRPYVRHCLWNRAPCCSAQGTSGALFHHTTIHILAQ